MIYCDYGALSPTNRQVLMKNIYEHLKPNGKFLLDVFSVAKYSDFQENRTWEVCRSNEFWREEEYIAFSRFYKYPDNVSLERISILATKETETYYLWMSYFTKDNLIKEMNAGFKVYTLLSKRS